MYTKAVSFIELEPQPRWVRLRIRKHAPTLTDAELLGDPTDVREQLIVCFQIARGEAPQVCVQLFA